MGQIYRAECACGFESDDLGVGCGMMDYNRCRVLAACPACHSIRDTDQHSGSRTCRKCKAPLFFLHEDGNFNPPDVLTKFKVSYPWESDRTADDDDAEPFPKVSYRCPRCGQMQLRLIPYGCWD